MPVRPEADDDTDDEDNWQDTPVQSISSSTVWNDISRDSCEGGDENIGTVDANSLVSITSNTSVCRSEPLTPQFSRIPLLTPCIL